MFSKILTQVVAVALIMLFMTTEAFSRNDNNWSKFNVNEVYEQKIAKQMHDNCAQSIKEYTESDSGFYQTACYAHIVGALKMRDMMLGVIGELQRDHQCLEHVSGSVRKWCRISDVKEGYTIYNLAQYYVRANDVLNSQYDGEGQYSYGTFSDFLLSDEYCQHGISNQKIK